MVVDAGGSLHCDESDELAVERGYCVITDEDDAKRIAEQKSSPDFRATVVSRLMTTIYGDWS